jgi:hypothetical protein
MEAYGGLPKRIVDVAWVVLPLITPYNVVLRSSIHSIHSIQSIQSF